MPSYAGKCFSLTSHERDIIHSADRRIDSGFLLCYAAYTTIFFQGGDLMTATVYNLVSPAFVLGRS